MYVVFVVHFTIDFKTHVSTCSALKIHLQLFHKQQRVLVGYAAAEADASISVGDEAGDVNTSHRDFTVGIQATVINQFIHCTVHTADKCYMFGCGIHLASSHQKMP